MDGKMHPCNRFCGGAEEEREREERESEKEREGESWRHRRSPSEFVVIDGTALALVEKS
jgi:hypothetical protein